MKQRISVEDFSQLTDEEKERLRSWWKPQLFDVFYHELKWDAKDNSYIGSIDRESYTPDPSAIPVLSIGQMIDILHARNNKFGNHYIDFDWEGEFVDALWEEIKQIL